MRGRKPIPTKIIDIRGGSKYTHHAPRTGEPDPPANIPECPEHLDDAARKEWGRMAAELEPLGLLTNLDKAVFAMYCQAFATWAKAAKELQKGFVRQTKNGFWEQNPYFPIANKAQEQMMKCLIELGMTPSSRSRVKVSEKKPKEKDAKERFFG